MLVLAIDTALHACAAALLDTSTGAMRAHESLDLARGHAEALMPLIARVMKAGDTTFTHIDRIAVTNGPGSFTGLRVGLSAARGLGLAADRPVIGVTTLSAYAAPHVAENNEHPIIAAIDARHGHVYFQVVSGHGNPLVPPRVAPLSEVARAARFGAPRLVGDAAQLVAQHWPQDAAAPVGIEQRSAPDIAFVGWLGAAVSNPAKAPARPFYLRPPDARPQAANAIPHAMPAAPPDTAAPDGHPSSGQAT